MNSENYIASKISHNTHTYDHRCSLEVVKHRLNECILCCERICVCNWALPLEGTRLLHSLTPRGQNLTSRGGTRSENKKEPKENFQKRTKDIIAPFQKAPKHITTPSVRVFQSISQNCRAAVLSKKQQISCKYHFKKQNKKLTCWTL